MDFLKKHYEKILLGIVLVGLTVAVAVLLIKIPSEKQNLLDLANGLIHPKVKPLTNLDLSLPELAVKRANVPVLYDFSSTNKLFNPMPWQQTPDKHLVRSDKAGPVAVVVTNITPLYLKISLDAVTLTSDGTPQYLFGVEKQIAVGRPNQQKKQGYVKVGEKNATFFLKEIKGPPAAPTNAVVELLDTSETALIPFDKDKPWKRVDGYTADLRYELQKGKTWPNQRVGANLNINGEDYNIVAISKNEVILSAVRNRKNWTIKLNNAS
jgi:hypothetical protein